MIVFYKLYLFFSFLFLFLNIILISMILVCYIRERDKNTLQMNSFESPYPDPKINRLKYATYKSIRYFYSNRN